MFVLVFASATVSNFGFYIFKKFVHQVVFYVFGLVV